MKHLAQAMHWPDGEPPEVVTWCDRLASGLPLTDRLVFEAILSDCLACLDARSEAHHNARPVDAGRDQRQNPKRENDDR